MTSPFEIRERGQSKFAFSFVASFGFSARILDDVSLVSSYLDTLSFLLKNYFL
jgi:hypothetical protein